MKCLDPEWMDVLPSTNTWLMERLRAGADLPTGYVVAARAQTAGRGWHRHSWVAVPGLDTEAVRRLAESLGVPLRVRAYNEVG